MKTVTFVSTLMRLAHELGQARLSGDEDRICKAQKAHDEYAHQCLISDEMILNYGDING